MSATIDLNCQNCGKGLAIKREASYERDGVIVHCPFCELKFSSCGCGSAASPTECRVCTERLFRRDLNSNYDFMTFDNKTVTQTQTTTDARYIEMGRHLQVSSRGVLVLYSKMNKLEVKMDKLAEKMEELITMMKFMPPSCGTEFRGVSSTTDVGK